MPRKKGVDGQVKRFCGTVDSAGPRRLAWLRPIQTDLIPDKGQFRSRFHHPLSYCCPATIFRDILASGKRAGKGRGEVF